MAVEWRYTGSRTKKKDSSRNSYACIVCGCALGIYEATRFDEGHWRAHSVFFEETRLAATTPEAAKTEALEFLRSKLLEALEEIGDDDA